MKNLLGIQDFKTVRETVMEAIINMRCIIFFLMCNWGLATYSQTISFKFQDGINDSCLKDSMECKISALLTEISNASRDKRDLSLAGLNLTEKSHKSLIEQWGHFHFFCEDSVNVVNCLQDISGYEVRGIPVTILPMDSTYNGSLYKDFVIRFNQNGQITAIHMALDDNTVSANISTNMTNLRRRREILSFVEEFRELYVTKDLASLRDFISRKYQEPITMNQRMGKDEKIRNKELYLRDLERLFSKNKHIDVQFDSIKVTRHSAKANFYGVTIHQKLRCGKYENSGYMFMLWEFLEKSDEHNRIHLLTWQPEYGYYDSDGNKRKIRKDEIYTYNDFSTP